MQQHLLSWEPERRTLTVRELSAAIRIVLTGEFGDVCPELMKTLPTTVTFDVSLLEKKMVTPLAGAGAALAPGPELLRCADCRRVQIL